MTLNELVSQLPEGTLRPLGNRPPADMPISDVLYDSRGARPGAMFVAMKGEKTDGHRFLQAAVAAGAVVVGEDEGALLASGGTAFVTSNARRAIAELACAFYRHPSREMDVIGVTGTNGKTTTVHLIERLYAGLGYKSGRIGTLGVKIGDFEEEGAHTTPEAPDLQRTLRKMADAGIQKVAMEVSSHALAQDRTWGTVFPTVVFTNLTQDHLDYHKDMEEYFAAKRRLFTEYEPVRGTAVLNIDDPYGVSLKDELDDALCRHRGFSTYGFGRGGDLVASNGVAIRVKHVFSVPGGTELTLLLTPSEIRVELPTRIKLSGIFNVYNVMAALATVLRDLYDTVESTMAYDALYERAVARGKEAERVVKVLETIAGAPGRFEAVFEGQDFAVIVDYAHTPDALENVLKAARQITPNGRVLTVFGCGGDRDRTKRPKMGHIAGELSDLAFVTSDNPRTEEPDAIVAEVVAGMSGQHTFTTNPDRRAAIFAAIAGARTGDTVVIAGKGHEDYQILGTEKHHFDDREVAREALSERRSQH